MAELPEIPIKIVAPITIEDLLKAVLQNQEAIMEAILPDGRMYIGLLERLEATKKLLAVYQR